MISVIIPAFNVEAYIKDAIESVQNQSHNEVEIIVVDDCSTDRTSEIVNGLARMYSNVIKCQTTGRLGPGGARNLGIQHSSGEYLFFLDGDDVLPNDALYRLSSKQNETGADIVIGNVIKYNEREEFDSNLHKKIKWDCTDGTTHISKRPDLFFDSTVTNKLYKKKFILDNELSFPESISYEDIIYSLKAHVLAGEVALVDSVVYKWRNRDDAYNPSITQSRSGIENFTDRMQILNKCFEFLVERSDFESVQRYWHFKVLTVDFFLYLKEFKHLNSQYQDILYDKIHSYLLRLPNKVLSRIPLKTRLLYQAILADDREELKLLLELLWSRNQKVSTENVKTYDMVYNTSSDWNAKLAYPYNHVLWTQPYNSYGCEKVGKASAYINASVNVKEEAATMHGSYCKIYKDDKELGWVDARALEVKFN
ncbi:glycosyltransferase [Terribacillus saccharophilus]|uniref:glycosyltransferase n=1 Tax=Terribacillus saccharophilus TaxID=361277 RepID=UPI003981ABA7